jgi:hypothetical protein
LADREHRECAVTVAEGGEVDLVLRPFQILTLRLGRS